MARYSDELLQRAVRLYRIPGVHMAEVCERLGISQYALKKARKSVNRAQFSRVHDLVISMLTDTGLRTSGPWPLPDELATMASYLDFVNKDGSTAETVAKILDELVDAEVLGRSPEGYILLKSFP
jgi:hypothetical protein